MKTSLYLTISVLLASLFTSCIKEPPCPLNQQKVEFVLDSAQVSLADYISLEPGDEVVIFEAEYFSMKHADTTNSDGSNAKQRKYRFDGKSFVSADGQDNLEPGETGYCYYMGDTGQHIEVSAYTSRTKNQ